MIILYRKPTKIEVTLLRRTFNKWGLFEVLEKSLILIKEYSNERIKSIDFNNQYKDKSTKDRIHLHSDLKECNLNTKSYLNGVFLFNSHEHEIDVLKNQPYHAGLLIGYIHRNFFPTIAFLEIVVTNSKSFSYIIVKEHTANLVLYGRDVFGDSILSSSKFEENTLVVILDSDRKPLGLGKTRYSSSQIFKMGKIAVSTISDLGQYLRDENKENDIF